MKMHHSRYYWIMVALAVAAFMLISTELHGQSAGAAAAFEGRPAMAGAQAGHGALAGPPQGGIGVQGNEVAERGLRLGKPSGLDEVRQAQRSDSADVAVAADTGVAAAEVEPARDRSLAKDERSGATKGKRAAKRTISRSRHGVSEIDSTSAATTR
jgi:hypothetical protein